MEHVRPIVDYTGSIGYRTSRALADVLAPLVGKSDHHLNNSKHLAKEMISVMVDEDEMFISHDVVSLYTNTPNRRLYICLYKLSWNGWKGIRSFIQEHASP